MTSTTHSTFDKSTKGVDVAKAFPESIRGKTVLITGVNRGGIGYSTAEAFASQSPAHLIVSGRNTTKLQECIDAIHVQFPLVDCRPLKLDLSSLETVRSSANEVLSWKDVPNIDILINNAGIMLLPTRTLSKDNIEMHFATNHIGHFLLTCLLMPKLIQASNDNNKGSTRIINVTSLSPTFARMRWSDINFDKINKNLPKIEQPFYLAHQRWGETGNLDEKSYLPLEGYNQSKVANLLFGITANKRLYEKYGILSFAVHPGVIMSTELGRNMKSETKDALGAMMESQIFYGKTAEEGASTTLVAALDPKLGVGEVRNGKENYGSYLMDCQISDAALPEAESSTEAERLWELSEQLVKEKFAW